MPYKGKLRNQKYKETNTAYNSFLEDAAEPGTANTIWTARLKTGVRPGTCLAGHSRAVTPLSQRPPIQVGNVTGHGCRPLGHISPCVLRPLILFLFSFTDGFPELKDRSDLEMLQN